jgi:hypothetical protein
MVDVLEESELLKRNVICIKKQFLCATSVKKMHWQVIEISFIGYGSLSLILKLLK